MPPAPIAVDRGPASRAEHVWTGGGSASQASFVRLSVTRVAIAGFPPGERSLAGRKKPRLLQIWTLRGRSRSSARRYLPALAAPNDGVPGSGRFSPPSGRVSRNVECAHPPVEGRPADTEAVRRAQLVAPCRTQRDDDRCALGAFPPTEVGGSRAAAIMLGEVAEVYPPGERPGRQVIE